MAADSYSFRRLLLLYVAVDNFLSFLLPVDNINVFSCEIVFPFILFFCLNEF